MTEKITELYARSQKREKSKQSNKGFSPGQTPVQPTGFRQSRVTEESGRDAPFTLFLLG